MKPLRITFNLSTPMVVPERPLHLDGILGAAMFRVAVRGNSPDPVAESANLGHLLEVAGDVGQENAWVWKASQLQFEQRGGIFWHHYVRRYEMNQWAEDKALGYWEGNKDVIPVGTGHQKGFSLQQPLAWITEAIGWCVGDGDFIETLLREEIDALGRNTRMGWGRVSSVKVEEAAADEIFNWRMRTLPISLEGERMPGHYPATANIRPPYWDRARWQTALEFDASANIVPAYG